MQEKILQTSNELFLNYGFKSITMDDIADKMGISKKTIYAYYKTKGDLVKACVFSVFNQIKTGIDLICEVPNNPIQELFNIKEFITTHLKDEKSSPIFQLKKYYPKLYIALQKKQFEVMEDCVVDNLNRGIEGNYYRKNMDVDFISRIYFTGVTALKDIDVFPKALSNMNGLMTDYLDYHIRAIATLKGLKKLDEILKNNLK